MINIITNPDKKFVEEVRAKIKENNGHCACAIVFDTDSKCMCKEFRDQIDREEEGYCGCGLYQLTITNE